MIWIFCSHCHKRFKIQASDAKRRRAQNKDGAIYCKHKCADEARKARKGKK
ncbi:MAG: hypothetical protein WC932_02530 [archaeon]